MEIIIIFFAIPIIILIFLEFRPEETCRNCKSRHGNYIGRLSHSDLGEKYSKKNGFMFHSKTCFKQFWREHIVCETCKKVRNYKFSVDAHSVGERFFFCTDICREKFIDIRENVWKRDQGICSMCSSEHNIHYDYLFETNNVNDKVAENIVLLCQECFLDKNEDF